MKAMVGVRRQLGFMVRSGLGAGADVRDGDFLLGQVSGGQNVVDSSRAGEERDNAVAVSPAGWLARPLVNLALHRPPALHTTNGPPTSSLPPAPCLPACLDCVCVLSVKLVVL